MAEDNPLAALGGWFNQLLGGGSSPQQSQPEYASQLFRHWPMSKPSPWAYEPSTADFWNTVQANQQATEEDAATRLRPIPSGPHKLRPPSPGPAPAGRRSHLGNPPTTNPVDDPTSVLANLNATDPPAITEAVSLAVGPRPVLNTKGTWTATSQTFNALTDTQKAAVIALMEADGQDPEAARNAAAAMVNRATKERTPLGQHVSARIYQPTFEPAQHARLGRILANPLHRELTQWIERYGQGQEVDPTGGATHFLAPERTMLALEAQQPNKYRSWRRWTGFDAAQGQYRHVTMRDRSHAFLAPNGRFTIPPLP